MTRDTAQVQGDTSVSRRQLFLLLGLAFVLGLPTVGVLLLYQVTKNPNLLPLAMTIDAQRADDADTTIEVEVAWVEGASRGLSQATLREAFMHSFEAKGVDAQVRFVPGKDVTLVRYRVGQNTIGPFQLDYAAGGINAAVDALHLTRKFHPEPMP